VLIACAHLLRLRPPHFFSLPAFSLLCSFSQSFFLAETLKYLWLLFQSDDKLVLSGQRPPGEYFVLNTECHPIKSWNSS